MPSPPRPPLSATALRRKGIIALTVAGGAAALLFALGLALGHVWVTALAVLYAIGAAVALRRRAIPDCPGPSVGEFALAAATATYLMAAVALVWLGVYWLIHVLLRGAEWTLSAGLGENRWAWFATLVWLGPVMLVAAARAATEMEAELYPATGLRSRYRDVLRFRGHGIKLRAIGFAVVLAVFVAAALAADLEDATIGTWLLVILGGGCATFAVPAGAQRLGSLRAPDVKRVADSAEAAGWEVLPNPQTGNAGIDPYLAEVDLFARKGSLSALVKVIQGEQGQVGAGQLDPVGWPVVATVLTAARSLPPDQLPEGVRTVEPVLVLLDAELQSEPLLFAAQNGVGLLSVDADGVSARAPDVPRLEAELQAIGERYRDAHPDQRRPEAQEAAA
jgi:hypothetical protein